MPSISFLFLLQLFGDIGGPRDRTTKEIANLKPSLNFLERYNELLGDSSSTKTSPIVIPAKTYDTSPKNFDLSGKSYEAPTKPQGSPAKVYESPKLNLPAPLSPMLNPLFSPPKQPSNVGKNDRQDHSPQLTYKSFEKSSTEKLPIYASYASSDDDRKFRKKEEPVTPPVDFSRPRVAPRPPQPPPPPPPLPPSIPSTKISPVNPFFDGMDANKQRAPSPNFYNPRPAPRPPGEGGFEERRAVTPNPSSTKGTMFRDPRPPPPVPPALSKSFEKSSPLLKAADIIEPARPAPPRPPPPRPAVPPTKPSEDQGNYMAPPPAWITAARPSLVEPSTSKKTRDDGGWKPTTEGKNLSTGGGGGGKQHEIDALLADLQQEMAHLEGGKICSVCDQIISGKDLLEVAGKVIPSISKARTNCPQNYHSICVKCHHCQRRLDRSTGYHEKDGSLYCERDYQLVLIKKVCGGCQQPIQGRSVRALGQYWHDSHLLCSHCKRPLLRGHVEHRGRAYCPEDFASLFLPKCMGCRKPVEKEALVALQGKWHTTCFVCQVTNSFSFLLP